MKLVHAFIAALLCLNAHAVLRWDSGIFGPPYKTILKNLESLTVKYAHLFTQLDYGKTIQDRPLRLYLMKKDIPLFGKRQAVLITGATHGNEYLKIVDRLPLAFLEKLQEDSPMPKFLDEGGVFLFVPIVNPDGYENRSRYNANGVDLNRDWDVPPAGHKGFHERESKQLAQQITQLIEQHNLDLKITVDYHCCGSQKGALLHPWSHTSKSLPTSDLSDHQAIAELGNLQLNLDIGATGQVLGYYPMGTTKDYFYSTYGALAYTYEGRYRKEEGYLDKHIAWWESVTAWLNRRSHSPVA